MIPIAKRHSPIYGYRPKKKPKVAFYVTFVRIHHLYLTETEDKKKKTFVSIFRGNNYKFSSYFICSKKKGLLHVCA